MTDLPMPRLQLRWRKPTAKEQKSGSFPRDWTCVYELILPLGEHDIRRKAKRDYQALEISRTFVGSRREVMEDTPFRDGAHAAWDSEALGNMPIYIVTSDGRHLLHTPTSALPNQDSQSGGAR